ncbi:MAG: AraC family transcriptional regulator [Acidobacteriota bacterium]
MSSSHDRGQPTPDPRLIRHLNRSAPTPGRHDTLWPGLRCFRSEGTTAPNPTVYMPSLCVVGQGAKRATSGDHVFHYDAGQYLVIGAAVPLHAEILDASPDTPFLSLVLDLDLSVVHELILELDAIAESSPTNASFALPLQTSALDADFLDAVLRFFDVLDDPADRKILAPSIYRELIYAILRREQGDLLRSAARRDGRSPAVLRAIRFIEGHFDQDLDVPRIASEVGMSTSSLHDVFKQATALTPIQYLKRYRLHRALELMLEERCQAAEAAWRVGYASASYFSREFKALYGLPPRQYIASGPLAARAG